MLRLIKYEIRKNITGLAILFGIIMALETYFVGAILTESKGHTATAIGLLVVSLSVAFFFVFAFGCSSYSKELKSKTGYMTFMTPISSYSIIGSKFLSTLIAGIVFVGLFILLGVIDMALVESTYPEIEMLSDVIDLFVEMIGLNAGKFWLSLILGIVSFIVDFFAIIAMAYLAVTLSATAFQNKKFKGFFSVLLFVGIMILYSYISDLFPEMDLYNSTDAMIAMLIVTIYDAVVMAICTVSSAMLLDKKVSL